MRTRMVIVIGGVLLCILLLGGAALAMSSAHYKLDWFTLLTGTGDGRSSSTHYTVNLTVGQSAIGTSVSVAYEDCLGYWCGAAIGHKVSVPLILHTH
ncbi:MAG: hypothetical protein J7M34_00750 [Anaerolineae bacterium]|nr:hypothetical protein [Anaerolineae bacterium]